MSKARLASRGALILVMALVVMTGACKKRLKLVDVDDDKKPVPIVASPPPIAQNDPPLVPPEDPPPAPPAEEEPPPIIPATAKVPVSPKPAPTTTAKPSPTTTTTAATTATTSAKTAGKTFPPTCAGTCEKALRCMGAYSEVEHASCVVECSGHPVNREKLADLNSKDCATLVAMLKKK